MLAHLNEMIKDSDKLTKTKRAELRRANSTKPGLNRYLRVTPAGCCGSTPPPSRSMRTSAASTCSAAPDPELPAEDIALGYKQLRQVERGWRDLKQVIDLRPVYHRKEERIRAHVILCWLALLLIRITETTTGVT
jgi:transposase